MKPKSKNIVIMVSGYKRAGKDFVSLKLNELIVGSKVMSFAEPMKDIIAITMDISKEELNEYKNKALEVNVILEPDEIISDLASLGNMRSILQRFGTEAMKKHFGNDVWAELLLSKMPIDEVVIISDWRFRSEYERLVKDRRIVTIRINDDNLKGDGHISEHDLDDFDFDIIVDNTKKDGSILEDIRAIHKDLF